MPLFTINSYYSEALKRNLTANVFLPLETMTASNLKVVTLLHGLCGNQNDWVYNTNALMAAEKAGIALILPQSDNGFFINSYLGNYGDSIIELLDRCVGWFGFSSEAKYHSIAGLSMGGYGALHTGFRYYNRFSSVGSFSGIVDIIKHMNDYPPTENNKWVYDDMRKLFDEKTYYGSDLDLLALLKKIPDFKQQNVYIYCGNADHMYETDLALYKIVKKRFPTSIFEESNQKHNWAAWNYAFERFTVYLKSLEKK